MYLAKEVYPTAMQQEGRQTIIINCMYSIIQQAINKFSINRPSSKPFLSLVLKFALWAKTLLITHIPSYCLSGISVYSVAILNQACGISDNFQHPELCLLNELPFC